MNSQTGILRHEAGSLVAQVRVPFAGKCLGKNTQKITENVYSPGE